MSGKRPQTENWGSLLIKVCLEEANERQVGNNISEEQGEEKPASFIPKKSCLGFLLFLVCTETGKKPKRF